MSNSEVFRVIFICSSGKSCQIFGKLNTGKWFYEDDMRVQTENINLKLRKFRSTAILYLRITFTVLFVDKIYIKTSREKLWILWIVTCLLYHLNILSLHRKKNVHLVLDCTGGIVFFIFFNAKNQENSK